MMETMIGIVCMLVGYWVCLKAVKQYEEVVRLNYEREQCIALAILFAMYCKHNLGLLLYVEVLFFIALWDFWVQRIEWIGVGILLCIGGFVLPSIPLIDRILGMLAVSSLLALVNVVHKNSFGSGDVMLYAVLGFLHGLSFVWTSFVLTLFYATLLCLFLLWKHKVKRNTQIPFAPFIVVGVYVTWLVG